MNKKVWISRGIIFAFIIFFIVMSNCIKNNSEPRNKLRILIITGGHEFDRDSFFAMFDSYNNIEYREVKHPQANNSYTSDASQTYDVLVFYDMNEDISADQKSALIKLLERGKGLVVLHHALVSYQHWDEYERIIGGHYHHEPYVQNGRELPASTYKHDVNISVHVCDPEHPVTKGLADFTIHDEVYGGFSVLKAVYPLLTTSHPESGDIIAWTNIYGRSRIVTIQLGHDCSAYENLNYRLLVEQAIYWASKRQ